MLLVVLYAIQLAGGANKTRSSRTWSSPGHLSLSAVSGSAAGRESGPSRGGGGLGFVSQARRCGFISLRSVCVVEFGQ